MDHPQNSKTNLEYIELLEEYLYWSAEEKTQWQITAQLINKNLKFSYKFELISNTLKIIRNKAGKMSNNDFANLKNSEAY